MSAPTWLQRGHRPGGDCHLGELVHDYVDDALSDQETLRADQHLLVCAMCRAEVEQERRLVAQLRGFRPDPARHRDLVAGLLGLAEDGPPPSAGFQQPAGPSLVTRGAPAQYQSARHSLAAALVAVIGCTGVGLVVSSIPARTSAPPRTPTPPTSMQVRMPADAFGLTSVVATRSRSTGSPISGAGPAAVLRVR